MTATDFYHEHMGKASTQTLNGQTVKQKTNEDPLFDRLRRRIGKNLGKGSNESAMFDSALLARIEHEKKTRDKSEQFN